MAKKLSLLLAAVAVLAFAIPSMASASEATLNGKRAAIGTAIVGTGTDITLKSSALGAITCETLNLKGILTVNNGTTVRGEGTTKEPTQAGCTNNGKAVNVTTVVLSKLESVTSGSATATFVATVDIAALTCTFTGTNVAGTYTSGTNVLNFTEATGVTSSPPACGTAKLNGSFALESGSTPLIIH